MIYITGINRPYVIEDKKKDEVNEATIKILPIKSYDQIIVPYYIKNRLVKRNK